MSATGSYFDWREIDYNPVASELLPHALLPYLSKGQSVLDVGCNKGTVSIFLARQGCRVLGVDLSPGAIAAARAAAARHAAGFSIDFCLADFLCECDLGRFDLVVMVRVLTCFPSLPEWETLLQRAYACLDAGGLLYIRDFTQYAESYASRYEAGRAAGWRSGSFPVYGEDGKLLFVAHHHSDEEISRICAPYQKLSLSYSEGLSMHGTPCRMFEFIGRKAAQGACKAPDGKST